MPRVGLDLPAHLLYHLAKVFRFLTVIRSLNRLQRPLMFKQLSFLTDESAQDVEFLRTQAGSLAADIDTIFLKIHAQLGSLDFRKRLFRAGASQ